MLGETIGNYRLTRPLGRGAMGSVYIGEHPLVGKRVAVKLLHDELARDPDVVRRMFVEARVVNAIRHENIVDVLDFGERRTDDGRPLVFIMMELLHGESLASRLKRGRLSVEEAAHVADQAAGALAASHAAGVIHRDIKPDNIFLTRRGYDRRFVKLLDFGVAKQAGGGGAVTQVGALVGTPAYMSPEQCAGREVDGRSDVYSLGVVLFEMLTGRLPFVTTNLAQAIAAHLADEPPPPSRFRALTPAVEAVVLRCLAKDPADRFATMDELRAALDAAVHATPLPAPAPEKPKPRRSHRTLVVALVGALVGLAASVACSL